MGEPVTPEPWDATRLEEALAAAVTEHTANRFELRLSSAHNGTIEIYTVEDPEDIDYPPLILVRKADGQRFEIEFDALAIELPQRDEKAGHE